MRLVAAISLFFALLFFQAVPALAQTDPEITKGLCSGVNLDVNNTNCTGGNEANNKINNLIHTVINLLSLVVGVVAVIMIIVGGLRYITSGGSDTGVTGAKNTILYAVIGLIIVALAQLLVRFVLNKVTNT
jgi:type IV secretion system pilin